MQTVPILSTTDLLQKKDHPQGFNPEEEGIPTKPVHGGKNDREGE